MIYKLVFCSKDVIEYSLPLSAQLLRTCKQIYAEGLPILYGENTFQIKISNTHGPHYRSLACSKPLKRVLGLPSGRSYKRDM